MKTRLQRIAAFCAILAVAWTALWPLVQSAHAVAFAEAMPLCHQAGMQVGADEAPMDQAVPGAPAQGKQHCPLCIMAFQVAFADVPSAPPPAFWTLSVALQRGESAFISTFESRLPQSRAPPLFLEG